MRQGLSLISALALALASLDARCWVLVVLSGCGTSQPEAAPWTGAQSSDMREAPRALQTGGASVGGAAQGPGVLAPNIQSSAARSSEGSAAGTAAARGGAGAAAEPAASVGAAGALATGASNESARAEPGVPPEVAAHAADWPLPNADYDNTRKAKTAIDSRTIGMLRESWRFALQIEGTAFGYFTANPLILGEAIYLQDMQSNVYVVERSSGELRWTRNYNEPTFGPNGVAIGWGKVFASVGDSAIVAIDLNDGKDVWKLSPELGRSEGMDIQPVVFDGRLYAATVPVSTSRGVYEGSAHGLLFDVSAEDGAQGWSFDTIDSADAWGDAAANGGGGAWYPPLIDAQRGLVFWGTGNPVPWPGTVEKPNGASRPGPNLYTSSLVAVDRRTGALKWHYQDQPHDIFDWDFQITPVRVRSSVSSGADMVIGAGKTGAVAALDADTGKLLWRTKVGKHENDELTTFPAQSITIFPGVLGGVMSAMAFSDGVLYVPSVDLSMSYDGNLLVPEVTGGKGLLTALDVRDGSVLWTAQLRGACYGAATIANDLVLTSDETGRVYAFARESGAEVWHYDAPGGINAPLVVAGDELLVAVGMERGLLISLSLREPNATAGQVQQPSAGSGGSAGAGAPASQTEPTFSAVYRGIIQGAGCNGGPACHSGNLAGQLNMSDAASAYAALVGVKAMGTGGGSVSCGSTDWVRVVPGDPDVSLLVQKLASTSAPCGQRMPPATMIGAAQLDQLRMWIANGANND